ACLMFKMERRKEFVVIELFTCNSELFNCRANYKKNNISSKKTKKRCIFLEKKVSSICRDVVSVDTENKMNKASVAIVRKRDLC
ncbi:hypothetical protein, partial [Acinetobacter colistiniresistens]|uniref:hypothetical protein n=1 Tax=Acinetobacter colistiniresistens TaxID=280145 RepID=UPI001C07EBE2